MPEEGAGHVREMGYEHLLVGSYDTREVHHTGDEKMDELLHEYSTSIVNYDELEEDFNEAYGILTITENQDQLKKINWDIHWLSASGSEEQFQRTFFLHEESMYWEQYGLREFDYFSWSDFFSGNNNEGQE
jgi:hypothetical protein